MLESPLTAAESVRRSRCPGSPLVRLRTRWMGDLRAPEPTRLAAARRHSIRSAGALSARPSAHAPAPAGHELGARCGPLPPVAAAIPHFLAGSFAVTN